MSNMDNDMHARFQRMLLGEPEPEPQPPAEPQPASHEATPPPSTPLPPAAAPAADVPPAAPQQTQLATPSPQLAPQPQPQQQQQEPAATSAPSPPPPPSQAPHASHQHVDANANLGPRPPAATPPSAPVASQHHSTSSRHLPPQPPSMVSIIQDQWVQLCDYFQRVQCANSSEERGRLVRELGIVEDSLHTILDALLTDRKQLVSTQLLHTHLSIFGGSLHGSELGGPAASGVDAAAAAAGGLNGGDGVSPSSSVPTTQLRSVYTAAVAATPAPSPASGFLLDGALTSLPPCYRFLFADAHRDDLLSSDESDAEADHAHNNTSDSASRDKNNDSIPPASPHAPTQVSPGRQPATATAAAAPKTFDEPSPIGSIFLLTLCQYAKQDEPPGVRSIILEFLVRLLQEADLPTDRAAYPAGDPVLSLLQLNPPLLIVPLLDMLRKVSKALDPSSTALRHGTTSLSSSLSYPWTGKEWNEEGEDGTFLQDAGRTQFVIFLSSLAEKMERVPALANFFVVEDGANGERSLFVLLDALLPYLTHDCSAPGWTHRRDTCRYALSAVVSLAKCPDPWIQDLVGKEDRVASRTLMAARTTLLTLCKIPDNDDSATQVLFLRDVLRFWATLTTMSPAVAEDLRLAALVEKEFYFQTLIPLLQSSDTHVYSAACLVAAQVLRELNGNAPVLTRGLANALLGTSIRKSSGRIIPRANHYDSVVTDAEGEDGGGGHAKGRGGATTLGQQEEAAAARLQVHPTTSFFLYYIVPHLSSNPYMSADERENSALLGYATTRWSTVKATLVLVQALVENVPEVFLREVFLMDMNSLADVLRKQRQNTSNSPTGPAHVNAAATAADDRAHGGTGKGGENRSSSPTGGVVDDVAVRVASLGLWSTAGAPPHLAVQDFYVAELHETTTSSAALGLQADRVGESVLTRLLRTEGNMSLDALRARQEVMTAMAQISAVGTGGPATAAASSKSVSHEKAAHAGSAISSGNCWGHAGVQRSPLTVALCEMVQHLDATPYTVSSLVADLVVALCVLPDLRVLYTLLDPAGGPLKIALCQLRDVLQHKISGKGAEVTLSSVIKRTGAATTAGAAAHGGSFGSSPLSAAGGAATAPSRTNVSLLILYDTLLQHWEYFTADAETPTADVRAAATAAAPPAHALGAGVPVETLRAAVEANSNVLHACLYAEYLLAHLDAVIGYSALSQNLMYLRTSI